MSTFFADAYYFIARINQDDQYHGRVIEFSKTMRANLVTTDWVLMEVADALAGSEVRNQARDYFLYLRSLPHCEVIEAARDLFDRALNYYHRHADKDWSLTDCTSFMVMRDLGIKEALTGDKHFEQAGFVALLK
jgi:predicted nucleic acid-binding protein